MNFLGSEGGSKFAVIWWMFSGKIKVFYFNNECLFAFNGANFLVYHKLFNDNKKLVNFRDVLFEKYFYFKAKSAKQSLANKFPYWQLHYMRFKMSQMKSPSGRFQREISDDATLRHDILFHIIHVSTKISFTDNQINHKTL